MKEKLIMFLKKEIPEIDCESLLEKPKVAEHGDFALPMFTLAKTLKCAPPIIAKEMCEKLSKKNPDFLSKIEAVGPYLNFKFNSAQEIKQIFESFKDKIIFKPKTTQKPQKILLEYPSPNTNKALHLGHVRNILLGNSLSKILSKAGHEIVKVNLNNDRGIAICKAMLSYKLWGKNDTPEKSKMKSDKFVAKYYVKFEIENKKNPELKLEEKAQEMLLQWEKGDAETMALWRKLLDWVLKGYKVTYKNYNYSSDKEYNESDIFKAGKEIVLRGLKNNAKGFGQEEDGAVFCDLGDIGLDKKYLLRKDGTTLYMTQDIYLAELKEKEFKADKYIYLTANEQDYHFKVLFEILERLGFGNKEKLYHLSYGYVTLPEGKMKSREGTVVEADELLDEVIGDAKENLLKKSPDISEKEANRRARIIGYGALAFFILKYNPTSDFVFNPKESLSFEGETGPYLQYTYARIQSLISKVGKIDFSKLNFERFNEKEIAIAKTLKMWPEVLDEAISKYKISAISSFLIKLAQQFNEFYQNYSVANAETLELKHNRVLLSKCVSEIIGEGLDLLGIEVLDEM